MARLEALVGSIAAGGTREDAMYAIPDLYLAAAEETRAGVGIAHHAYPFAEPGSRDVYVRARWYDAETGNFLSHDPLGYQDSSNGNSLCGGDPLNCHDPDGRVRRTRNGGVNWIGNAGDVMTVTGFWSGAASTTLDTLGNTVSELLGLDIVADAAIVSGNSSRPGHERVLAGAKGALVAAFDVAGGTILKGAGGLIAKVPGVGGVIERVAASQLVKAVAGVSTKELASLALLDDAIALVRSSTMGRFLRRDAWDVVTGVTPEDYTLIAYQQARLAFKKAATGHIRSETGVTVSASLSREGTIFLDAGSRNFTRTQDLLFSQQPGVIVDRMTARQLRLLNDAGAGLPGLPHAEVKSLHNLYAAGHQPRVTVAYPRRFCPGQCGPWLPTMGADLLSDRIAFWFSPVNLSNRVPLGGVFNE